MGPQLIGRVFYLKGAGYLAESPLPDKQCQEVFNAGVVAFMSDIPLSGCKWPEHMQDRISVWRQGWVAMREYVAEIIEHLEGNNHE